MEELKKIIQAIVISNAGCPMTILQLDRDFKCHEGYTIPFEKYGFQQLDAMLRSISDAVQIKGKGSSALVLPVITQKSKHIREMVVKHKKNGQKRKAELSGYKAKKGKFQHFDCPRTRTSDDVVISTANHNFPTRSGKENNNVVDNSCFTMVELKKLIQAMVISKPGSPLTVAELANDFKHHEGTDIPYRDHGFQQLDALLRSIPDVVKLVGQGPSALVYPVTSEKSKHIKEMIKAQKNNSKRCYNRTAYSSRSTRHSSKGGSKCNSRNGWAQSSNVRNGHSSKVHGNGQSSYGASSNHSKIPNYAKHGCASNRKRGHGNNFFNTNRYSGNVYNVPNPFCASNDNNPNWNPGYGYNAPDQFMPPSGPNGCNSYRNPWGGYNAPGQAYAPNGYGMNDFNTNRYPGHGYNVPNQAYASNGNNNWNWNPGNGYNAPDQFMYPSGPGGCNSNRNPWGGYYAPGQAYAPNGYGMNDCNTNRYPGHGYNVPNHAYASNGNNNWNWNPGNGYNAPDQYMPPSGPGGCNSNRNPWYGPNGYSTNNCNTNRYPGNGYNVPNQAYASNGNNPNWNAGYGCNVPDYFNGPNGRNANRNPWDVYNVPGQPYAPNAFGMDGCHTNRYPGNGHNVPNHFYASNGNNPNWNPGNSYNTPHYFYTPNGFNAERYAGNGTNVHGKSYAPNGYNPNRNAGDDLSVPGHSYAPRGCDAYGNPGNSNVASQCGGTNDSYYAALLGLYHDMMGSDVNFPYQVLLTIQRSRNSRAGCNTQAYVGRCTG